jgi:hypothetical protein
VMSMSPDLDQNSILRIHQIHGDHHRVVSQIHNLRTIG